MREHYQIIWHQQTSKLYRFNPGRREFGIGPKPGFSEGSRLVDNDRGIIEDPRGNESESLSTESFEAPLSSFEFQNPGKTIEFIKQDVLQDIDQSSKSVETLGATPEELAATKQVSTEYEQQIAAASENFKTEIKKVEDETIIEAPVVPEIPTTLEMNGEAPALEPLETRFRQDSIAVKEAEKDQSQASILSELQTPEEIVSEIKEPLPEAPIQVLEPEAVIPQAPEIKTTSVEEYSENSVSAEVAKELEPDNRNIFMRLPSVAKQFFVEKIARWPLEIFRNERRKDTLAKDMFNDREAQFSPGNNIAVLMNSDRISQLEQGRFIARGSLHDLAARYEQSKKDIKILEITLGELKNEQETASHEPEYGSLKATFESRIEKLENKLSKAQAKQEKIKQTYNARFEIMKQAEAERNRLIGELREKVIRGLEPLLTKVEKLQEIVKEHENNLAKFQDARNKLVISLASHQEKVRGKPLLEKTLKFRMKDFEARQIKAEEIIKKIKYQQAESVKDFKDLDTRIKPLLAMKAYFENQQRQTSKLSPLE